MAEKGRAIFSEKRSPLERFMSEMVLIVRVALLVEAIHVQLPHKGRIFRVFKVLWQHLPFEFLQVLDDKAVA